MKKILYVITGLGMGGAEHIVANLADKAHSKGFEVKIAYLIGDVKVRPTDSGIELVPLGMKSYFSLGIALWRLCRLMQRFKPDVVHSHMIHANLLARFSRIFIRCPRLVCSAHSSNEGGGLRMLAYHLTNRLGDVFTNVSHNAARALEKAGAAPAGSIVPILNGIDAERFKPYEKRKNDVFTIIAVGRLEEVKDYPNLLGAISMLSDCYSDFKLRVVGDGSQRAQLEALADSLRLSGKVEWLGVRQDIPELLNRSDLFVLTSAWEGFGLVVAEAMACGLPVVATDCGGVKEVVGDVRSLVKPKDSAALAAKIVEVMNMPSDKRDLVGKRNRQRIVDNYSLNTMFDNYRNLYKL
ncbi:glycosyltransferase [Pseudomonas stutzeri]|uniref:glycosyltransferase n=1 Tax=Stutzerimonas stutzeri TaxID=316 RepID=UPI001F52A3AC|nr:glycosyltransferase [Stutzerimonas stutzeri]MCI0916087.1 glycosyltransferase [Stutzerimonas stutzeri]